MSLREFIQTLWLGKYYVAAAMVVALAGAIGYTQSQSATYQASADVQIMSASAGGTDQAAVTVDTDPDIVTSDAVLEAAVAALEDGTTPDQLRFAVSATYDPNQLIMRIAATSSDGGRAVELANAVADSYVNYLPTVLQGQIDALDARRGALRSNLDEVDAQLAANPTDPLATAEMDSIIVQYQAISAQRSAYQSMVTLARVVAPATGSVLLGIAPAAALAIAGLAGLLIGIGAAFARRGFDPSVRTAADAARLSGSPVLAELYDLRRADREFRRTQNLPVATRQASPFTESIRELRTAVQVSLQGSPHTAVVVTAADPLAPRAFITANLAASFALSGRPTVVVSGDLRRPQLDVLLGPEHPEIGRDGAPGPTRIPNLDFVSVNDEAMDPADYLATAEVRELVDDLTGAYAVAVVDAPPVLAAADATILGGYADGVVIVATAGQTDKSVLQAAAERLRINHVALLGVVLVGVRGDRRMHYASTYGSARADGQPPHTPPAPGTAQAPDTAEVLNDPLGADGTNAHGPDESKKPSEPLEAQRSARPGTRRSRGAAQSRATSTGDESSAGRRAGTPGQARGRTVE